MHVHVSGPAAVGVARSIKAAFPDARVTGVGVAVRVPEIDDVIRAEDAPPHAIPAPSPRMLDAIRKPELRASEWLGLRVPAFIRGDASQYMLHRFGRRLGWRLSVEGRTVASYEELNAVLAAMRPRVPDVFVQEVIGGVRRSLAFAARDGRLLGAADVRDGAVTSVDASDRERLERLVAATGWTGGGEVVIANDFLVDARADFPEHVHGITLCGINLPALFVSCGAAGSQPAEQLRRAESPPLHGTRRFARIAIEVPIEEQAEGGKSESVAIAPSEPDYPTPDVADVLDVAWTCATPARLPLGNAMRASFERIAAVTSAFGHPRVTMALSIKTEPSPLLARMARAYGWWAEGISADEVRWSLQQGFDSSNVILNGPLTHRHAAEVAVAIAFADTVDAFREILRSDRVATPGIRVHPPSVTSRFGVALNDESLDAIAAAVRESKRTYGVHFHRAIPVIGPDAWWRAADEVVEWASRIAERGGIAPIAIDFGGGWHADDFFDVLLPRLGDLHARVASAFPTIERMFFEPGKAIAAPSSCLVATIADVRMANGHVRDIVVDTSIAQLPTTRWMPHRALHLGRDGSRTWLGSGSSRVLGNVCMEVDVVLENVGFTRVPQAGDRLLIADAGAYDASMAWPFARGKMAE